MTKIVVLKVMFWLGSATHLIQFERMDIIILGNEICARITFEVMLWRQYIWLCDEEF